MNTSTNTGSLKEKAEKQFLSLIGKKVLFLADKCWPTHVGNTFREINDLIEAGKKLEAPSAVSAKVFTDQEIDQMVGRLSPLLELEMKEDVKAAVVEAMTSHQIPVDALNQLAVK